MNGWTEWCGGEMPVDGGTIVDVRLGNGAIVTATRADRLLWGRPRQETGREVGNEPPSGRVGKSGGMVVAYRELEAV